MSTTLSENDVRFPGRYGYGNPLNPLGYGLTNPWTPPLEKPETLLGLIDKWLVMLFTGGPFIYYIGNILPLVFKGSLNQDAFDGYFYNNAKTVGEQLYPQGIYKYYDMSSSKGLIKYSIAWFIELGWWIISPLTLLIPFPIWVAAFKLPRTGMWKYFVYYVPWMLVNPWIGMLFNIEIEGGYGMLWD